LGALAVTGGVVAGCSDILDQGPGPLMFGLDATGGRVLWQRDLALLRSASREHG
jgi:hypothetical protein